MLKTICCADKAHAQKRRIGVRRYFIVTPIDKK